MSEAKNSSVDNAFCESSSSFDSRLLYAAANSVRSINVAICSGGTGGHMFPACALFDSLKARGCSVSIITDARGDRFCKGIDPAEKLVLPTLRFNIHAAFKLFHNFFRISLRLRSLWKSGVPDIIVGFGSSFTIAPILVGKSLKSKVLLYEQNSILGRANKFLERLADYRVSTFAIDEKWKQLPLLFARNLLRRLKMCGKSFRKVRVRWAHKNSHNRWKSGSIFFFLA